MSGHRAYVVMEDGSLDLIAPLEVRHNDTGDAGRKTEWEAYYRGAWRRVFYWPSGSEYVRVDNGLVPIQRKPG